MFLRHRVGPRSVSQRRSRSAAPLCKSSQQELRVCTNRTCKRQGSQAILKLAKDLALPELEVNECGCLGSCGAGPNVVLLPQGLLLHHVATPADLAQLLSSQCQLQVSQTLIKATELRLAGNSHAMSGDLPQAVDLYTQALALPQERGRHMLLANRSAAHLQLGDKHAALQDAQAAVQCAPSSFATAWVRLIDAHYALGQHREAAEALVQAKASCPSFTTIPEHKAIQAAISNAIAKR